MEEAKTQENAKLQSALEEMQLKFKETKETLMKEQEAAKKVVEKIPIIHEVPVIDTAMLNKLTIENEKLKVRQPKLLDVILLVSLFYILLNHSLFQAICLKLFWSFCIPFMIII